MKSALLLALFLGVIGFVPLMGGPRYEAALIAGLIGPAWVAVAVSMAHLRGFRELRKQVESDGIARAVPVMRVVADSLFAALYHVLAVIGVATLHGFYGGFCEPALGYLNLLLGPGLGMLLGALMGTATTILLLGLWGRRSPPLLLSALGVTVPLTCAIDNVITFYRSPTVYAYDAFVGYFAGPVYDAVTYDVERLFTYRSATLLTLVAWVIASSFFKLKVSNRVTLGLVSEVTHRWLRIVTTALAFGVSSMITASGHQLGHSGSADWIRTQLGRKMVVGACHVHFSSRVRTVVAQSVARECVGHLAQLEAYFEIEKTERVDVYLFADVSEKKTLMGAGRTNIAKPWRSEVYISEQTFPHSVLGHELAHVVAGRFGRGPFSIAGNLGGWIPDPGRIEGFAEAAAVREESFGTLQEWAAAMKAVGRLPPLSSLFQLRFLGSSAVRSYTAAGSFVDFVREKHGVSIAKQWYGGQSIEALTHSSMARLEVDWHSYLDTIEVPEPVLKSARPRFSRQGVFERRCPHAVDRKLQELGQACSTQEEKARRLIVEILALDASQLGLHLEAPRCTAQNGDNKRAQKETEDLLAANGAYEDHERKRAFDFLGDLAWERGEYDEAKRHYQASFDLTFDPEQARQVEVKLWALHQSDGVRKSLQKIFVPDVLQKWSFPGVLFEWVQMGQDADFAYYLLARQAIAQFRFEEAHLFLQKMRVERLPLDSLKRESIKMEVAVDCHLTHPEREKRLKAALDEIKKQNASAAETEALSRQVERCLLVSAQK